METKFNFTDNRLRTLRHDGTNKRIIFYDKAQSGLALQLTPTGTKTFQIRTWDNRTKKPVIKRRQMPFLVRRKQRTKRTKAIAVGGLLKQSKDLNA